MTNERHEKALEAAVRAYFGNDKYPPSEGNKRDISDAITAYVEAMEAVIVPKEPTEEMQKASRIVIDLRGAEVSRVTTWGVNAWESILAAAPNHFTNGE